MRSIDAVRAALLALCACALQAHAARPFVTDDARVVDPGGYQIESFYKRQSRFDESEFWLLPAMNPGGRVELTLGGMRVDGAASAEGRTVIAQAKTLLRPLETGGVGFAVTLGVAHVRPSRAPSSTNPYLNGIGSLSLLDDRVIVHANLGAQRDRVAGITRATWGFGGEFPFSARFTAIAESFGQDGEKPTLHAGLRFWLVPNRVQLDGTAGRQNSGPPRREFVSAGMRLLF